MERLHFYGGQAELFLFYQLPKVLFTDPPFRMISAEAKILYGLLLDRMSLSAKNGWLDSDRIRFVLMCLRENTTQVRNMRQYLLASL